MNKIKFFRVDAFTDHLFSGNPAAVCMLEDWIGDEIMQSVAAENNLAETAFIVPEGKNFGIRWFTPSVEVDLCGHATLATAYVLFNCLGFKESEIILNSPKSGQLKISMQNDTLFLDFPTDTLKKCNEYEQISNCIGYMPDEVYKGRTDYIAVVDSEDKILNLLPDLIEISKLNARGLIVTAKGYDVDFVSRFFAPQSGIDEDPVTGSAHTSLIPLWSEKLGKTTMNATQLSKRRGKLICINKGNRSLIGGKARLYMEGEISIG
ncbi:MAG: PhzF family phenazine biosynthesis protein [Candidatus Gastranaerophilales bacterium]|nr:PhzF family phenazine biosynthesis protein [Candidatus Gastranaerophilales bacterium]